MKSKLSEWLTCFIEWIGPEPEKREDVKVQAQQIRDRIRAKAEEDELIIKGTPKSGSFATKTGLRRHMLGDAEVEGQDVDIPFIVAPKTSEEEKVDELLVRFKKYADASYPETKKTITKSSVNLIFSGTFTSYDLVPVLATDDPQTQILLRSNGEKRRTSLQKQVEFIKKRTRESAANGDVIFNECVRLVKWWRYVRQAEGVMLKAVPSVVINLLCAKAYDQRGVGENYAETLADWFGFMAHVARSREHVAFDDFYPIPSKRSSTAAWEILDPTNSENNVVSSWAGYEVDEFADWLEKGRDSWARAIRCDLREDHVGTLRNLVDIFGNSISNHCGEK